MRIWSKNTTVLLFLFLFASISFAALKNPSGLVAEVSNDIPSTLRWNTVKKADYYKVRLETSRGILIKKWGKTKNRQLEIDEFLDSHKKYQFKVKPCTKKRCGEWSKYKKFNTNEYTKNQVGSDEGDGNEENESENDGTDSYICDSNIYNCSDFNTQTEAQNVHDYCMGQIGNDIHALDADNNGEACESLNL